MHNAYTLHTIHGYTWELHCVEKLLLIFSRKCQGIFDSFCFARTSFTLFTRFLYACCLDCAGILFFNPFASPKTQQNVNYSSIIHLDPSHSLSTLCEFIESGKYVLDLTLGERTNLIKAICSWHQKFTWNKSRFI